MAASRRINATTKKTRAAYTRGAMIAYSTLPRTMPNPVRGPVKARLEAALSASVAVPAAAFPTASVAADNACVTTSPATAASYFAFFTKILMSPGSCLVSRT